MDTNELLDHAITFQVGDPFGYRCITLQAFLLRDADDWDGPKEKLWRIENGRAYWKHNVGFVFISRGDLWNDAPTYAFTNPKDAMVLAQWIYEKTKDHMKFPWMEDEDWFEKNPPPLQPNYQRG